MQGRPGMAFGGRPNRGKATGSMVIRGSGATGVHMAKQGSWKTPIERVSFPFDAATSRTLQVVIQERSMPATWSECDEVL